MELRLLPTAGRTVTRTAAFGSIVAVMILLAGCSGSGQAATPSGGGSAQPAAGSGAAGNAGSGQSGQRGMPGVFGLIAEVDGSTLQVQSDSAQTAVSYTSKTSVEQIKTATADDVAAGWCATVVSKDQSSATPGTTPSKITASSVSLTKPSSGTCGFGGGAGGGPGNGQRASGFPSARPGGGKMPTARPSGRASAFPSGRAFGGVFASGKITKVSGSGFVLAATSMGSKSTRSVTVTLTKDTTLTTQRTAKKSAIKQGECVRASGKTDDTGAVTATRLIVSAAQNGACTETGFGGFGGRQGGNGSNG